MDDHVLSPGAMLGAVNDSSMDFDFMDELLSQGFWLETADGSEFLHQSPSNSSALVNPPFLWPTNDGDLSTSLSQNYDHGGKQRSMLFGNLLMNESDERSSVNTRSVEQNMLTVAGCSGQSEDYVTAGADPSRRWWTAPRANPGPATSVMERLMWSVKYMKDFMKDKNFLVQIWVPVNRGGRCVLTTRDQPFSIDLNSPRLLSYRDISVNYHFPAQEDSKELVGLPGRVFLGKVPEWTPDVRFFRNDEFPRVDHALQYDVRGTLALPVFEQGSRTCLGVIEVVMTTQKIKYSSEIESVCKALEAVNLRSSEVLSIHNVNLKGCDNSYQVLPEIQEVLRSACETHRLPLVQTWVPCIQQGKVGCRHSDENYAQCASTVDHACYVADPRVWGFHEACSEHHLLKGQGVAGQAFLTNQPCFSNDVTFFGKTEYPLSHHARMFGLSAAVAIRLRSIHSNKADFVLEFFLPMDCKDPEDQKKMLSSLSIVIQQVCRSLRVVTDKEVEEEHSIFARYSREHSSQSSVLMDVQQNDSHVSIIQKGKSGSGEYSSETMQHDPPSSLKGSSECDADSSVVDGQGSFSSIGMGKTGEKRRSKAEKNITLQVLQQHFAGSLKDAAKNIGVCPTTLKRICRLHGIKRWPSRKIKKVGHSLQKLQLVIDSVQGASGSFQVDSFYTNFPELASPKLSRNSPVSNLELSDHPIPPTTKKGGAFSPQVTKSKTPSSSCSQSSSSSDCCSSRAQQQPSIFAGSNDPMVSEKSCDGVLERVRSDAELHTSTQQRSKPLQRSWSHKSFSGNPDSDSLLPLPKSSDQISREQYAQRVKVTYGDEKIRFCLRHNWGFETLLQEIARRFSIDDTSGFDLRYLDDEYEWVLLTCDADLIECMDICRSSQSHVIKLSLHIIHHDVGSTLDRTGHS